MSFESTECEYVLMMREKINFQAASGICTPSNPNLHFGSTSSNGALTPYEDSSLHHVKEQVAKLRLSSYKVLGETEDLKLVGTSFSIFDLL